VNQRTILDSLIFPEGLRWHDGHLWFCDIETHDVIKATAEGAVVGRIHLAGEHPIGLGWMPDGDLIVSGRFQRLFAWRGDAVEPVADLCADGGDAWSNDLTIDRSGRVYLADFGMSYDLDDHASNAQRLKGVGGILMWEPGTSARRVADGLSMPNTMQITPDGTTMLCSDSFGNRVVKYRVAADGSLGDPEVFAEFESMPDGSALDADGALWVALPHEGEVRRVRDGGEVTQVVSFDQEVFDVALGGPDGRTLFAAVSSLSATSAADADGERPRPGAIRCVDVAVAGATPSTA
jgi:sugar lactone lactonase YvrE